MTEQFFILTEKMQRVSSNLISNDINKVSDANSCFSSLLTPQGKFLCELS